MKELIKYTENPIAIKAIPEKDLDLVLKKPFKHWLCQLLSIMPENEEKVDAALPTIKKHFWSLGFPEIKEAFEMYADSKTALIPRSNYFDRVLVGQIFEAYKQIKQTRVKPKMDKLEKIEQEKALQDKLDIELHFDQFLHDNKIPVEASWIAVYLDAKGIWDINEKEKKFAWDRSKEQIKDNEERKNLYCRYLLRRYFERLKTKGKHIKELI